MHRTDPIGAVVFDMGGVLTVDPYQALRDYAIELQIPSEVFVEHLRGPQFAAVETGAATMRDFLKFSCTDVMSRFGVRVEIRRLADVLAAGQQIRPEMVELVGELAAAVKVGLLTNNVKEARSWWTSGVLPLSAFTAVIDSSDVGIRKPDPRIFTVTAQRLGCVPDAVLFFDDIAENVEGARSVGMIAEVFTDSRACRQVCDRYGLLGDRPWNQIG